MHHIPYANNLPPRVAKGESILGPGKYARLINNIGLVSPKQRGPTWEPEVIPEAAANHPDWGDMIIHTWEINTHMQEMGENAVDAAHFHYVHGTDEVPEAAFQNFDGHIREGKFITRQPTPRGVVDGAIETRSQGAGLSVVRFTGIYDTLLLANVTPVGPEKTYASYAFIQPRATQDTRGKTVGQAIIGNMPANGRRSNHLGSKAVL